MTGEEIRRLRLKMRLNQEQFAERLHVTRWTIIRWESNQQQPLGVFAHSLSLLAKEPSGQA